MPGTENMDVAGPFQSASVTSASTPALQIGGLGYGIPTIRKPCMEVKPDIAHLVGRRPGGGGQFGCGGRAPPFLSLNARGSTGVAASARRIQEALVSNRLAQAVGELATIQIRDALEKAFFPGVGIGQQKNRKGGGGGGMPGNLRARLGLGHGKIIKTGGGGAKGRGRGPSGGLRGNNHQGPSSGGRQSGKWGKDADRDTLDAELDQYVAERKKNSLASLDAELDRYQSRTAVVRSLTMASDGKAAVSTGVTEKNETASESQDDDDKSLPCTQESSNSANSYRHCSKLVMNIGTPNKDKDVDMEDEGDDFDDTLEIDIDC